MMPSFPFERSRDGMTLSDAIILTNEELAGMTLADLVAMADARFEAWVAAVNAPAPEGEPEE